MSVVAGIAIAPAAANAQATETVLHSFGSIGPKGAEPLSPLLRDAAGNLYGATYYGGPSNKGVVFKVDPAGQETTLYSFTGGADGAGPTSGLIGDGVGNLYGTNSVAVYKLDSTGHLTVLYRFTGGADGGTPVGGVVRDAAGNLYGTTLSGGSLNGGVVFKVDPAGQETVLYAFPSGSYAGTGVILDPAGNLYGTVGPLVFRLDPTGQEHILHNFGGGVLCSGLVRDSAGNLYGTWSYASESSVFKVDPLGNETDLLFGSGESIAPAGVVRDAAGNLYGTIQAGPYSVVFKLDPAGHKTTLYITEHGPFIGGLLILDAAGNLYGIGGFSGSAGGVAKLDVTGKLTVLYSFPRGRDGDNPAASLMGDAAGNLYGTTYDGGSADKGVVYKLDSAGRETILYNFTGGNDGANPNSGVIPDSAGHLYGTTFSGGASN